MKITTRLQLLGFKVIEEQRDCFGKWNCTIYEDNAGNRIYHQKYQGWYDNQGKDLIIK